MKKQLKISLIIPTYNEEKYIGKCLDSVFNLSRIPDEIIVVDNNSKDSTCEIVKHFKSVKLLKEKKQGQVFARQLGFNHASGDYLFTVDADVEVDKGWLKIYEDEIIKNNYDAISGQVYGDDSRWIKIAAPVFNFYIFTVNRVLCGHHITFGSNMGMSRLYWQKIRSGVRMDPKYYEDYEYSFLIAKHGGKIGNIKKPYVKNSERVGYRGAAYMWDYLSGWHMTVWRFHKIAAIIIYPIEKIGFLLYLIILLFYYRKSATVNS